NFEANAHVVDTLAALGRYNEAATQAAETLVRFRAAPDSITLVKDVYKKMGRESAVTQELKNLYQKNPEHRFILFALVDMLRGEGKSGEAQQLLAQAAVDSKYELEVVRR